MVTPGERCKARPEEILGPMLCPPGVGGRTQTHAGVGGGGIVSSWRKPRKAPQGKSAARHGLCKIVGFRSAERGMCQVEEPQQQQQETEW